MLLVALLEVVDRHRWYADPTPLSLTLLLLRSLLLVAVVVVVVMVLLEVVVGARWCASGLATLGPLAHDSQGSNSNRHNTSLHRRHYHYQQQLPQQNRVSLLGWQCLQQKPQQWLKQQQQQQQQLLRVAAV